jgi:MoxR-like ATPase
MNVRANQPAREKLVHTISQVGSVLLGKEEEIRLALCCLLARGHLLIEDLPGMGKTTLANGLAITLGLSYNRIQFTSDLLPSDIVGISVYQRESETFRFHPGPVFTQLLLADEINRTTPKTQSALLEAMAERQVTVDGETRSLPEPFYVIATQNPSSQSGTYPLPESQQDRFAMCISLGYPDARAEKAMLLSNGSRAALSKLTPVLSARELIGLQNSVDAVRVSDGIADYVVRLAHYTRSAEMLDAGLSPRAALVLLSCGRAWALLEGREYVIPEDIQAVFPAVVRHRLQVHGDQLKGAAMIEKTLNAVDIL